jgi:hypothetical protein
MNGYSSELYIKMPTTNSLDCGNQSNLGVSDPLDVALLGPRPGRAKITQQLKDYILLMLGAPVVSIELDDQQLDAAVDLAFQIYEEWAPMEFFRYYVFKTNPGQSIYKMPPEVGWIRNVYYKTTPTFAFSSSDLGGAIPIEYFYPGGAYASIQGGMIDPTTPIWGRAGEWSLYSSYEYQYSRIASNIGGWEWYGGYDHIKLYPRPHKVHHVIVQYIQKNNDYTRVQQAMQDGALAFAKIMLGRIRSKIKNPPGPNGGVQLDGDTLLQEGNEDKKKWLEDLITRYGDVLPITLGTWLAFILSGWLLHL